jgi:Tat protein translocase TatB subunit
LFLLILESLGTWELLLVAIVALVVFGPRKIPELARKAGKILHEFRQVSNEFRDTWEREVKLDDDEKTAFDFSEESIKRESPTPEYTHPAELAEEESIAEADTETGNQELSDDNDAPREGVAADSAENNQAAPEIKEVTDPRKLERLEELRKEAENSTITSEDDPTGKTHWL